MTVAPGSSYVSVCDLLRESTFQKDSDDDTKDLCAFCLSIGEVKTDARYFCKDCGPFGRLLCAKCLIYHKQFRKEHVSVKSFATAMYDQRFTLKSSRENSERSQEENDPTSLRESLHHNSTTDEVSHELPKRLTSTVTKDTRIHSLQKELKKTKKEVAQLRRKIKQYFEDVQESITPPDGVSSGREDTGNGTANEQAMLSKEEPIRNKQWQADSWTPEARGGGMKYEEVDLNFTSPPLGYTTQSELSEEEPITKKTHGATVAEQYTSLFNNQWDDAFDIAKEYFPDSNKETRAKLLREILQEVYDMCKQEYLQQDTELNTALFRGEKPWKEIPARVKEDLESLKLSVISEGTDNLTKKFISNFDEGSEMGDFLQEVEEYVHECFAISWRLALQKPQPDLYMDVRHLQTYNKHLFGPLTVGNSEKVDYIVWPALIARRNNGQRLLAKGVVKCLKIRYVSKTARARSARKHGTDREISKSARLVRKKKSSMNSTIPLHVTNITLHEPKMRHTKGNRKWCDESTSRVPVPESSGQQVLNQRLRDLYEKAITKTPKLNTQGQKILNNMNTGDVTTRLHNFNIDNRNDTTKLPHI